MGVHEHFEAFCNEVFASRGAFNFILHFSRPVAQFGRAAVSKTAGWGFESLLACHILAGFIVDSVKLLASLGLLVAAIAGFYVYEDQALWMRLLGMLALVSLAVFVAVQTEKGRGLWRFASQAQVEVRKVIWPTRQETLQTLLIIAVAVLLTSLFLWAIDSFLSMLVLYATGQG